MDALPKLEARIERLEAIAVLLCEQATRGQGQSARPFQDFIDDWRREHRGPHYQEFPWQA
jgi:hypothetical protein